MDGSSTALRGRPDRRFGRGAVVLTVAAATLLAASAARAQEAATAPAAQLSYPAVQAAVANGVKYLYSKQDAQGRFTSPYSTEYAGGVEALALWALLESGEPLEDARIRRSLNYVKAQAPAHTYTRALRTILYSRLGGDEDNARRLGEDARWLMKEQQRSGGWGYGAGSAMTRLRPEWTDASNSQFAVFALAEACEAGVPVPRDIWALAEVYWRKLQNSVDGGWGYQNEIGGQRPQRPESHGSMTAAGVVTSLLLADKVGVREGRGESEGRRPARSDAAERGLKWLADNYAVDRVPKYVWMQQAGLLNYYLLVLQRVVGATGDRTIASHDVPVETAALLVQQQRPDGSWNDAIVDTAFALLCLARADAPVTVAQIDDGSASVREIGAMSRWLGRSLGRPAAFKLLRADSPPSAWEAPLLLISARGSGELPGLEGGKLKEFMGNGGTLLVLGSPEDSEKSQPLLAALAGLFPEYRQEDVSKDHLVYRLRFPTDVRVRMTGFHDGCRTRIFVVHEDAARYWGASERLHQGYMALAGNLMLYASGGERLEGRLLPRGRGEAPPVRKFISIARLKHAGDWNACPMLIPRLSDALARSLSVGIKEAPAVEPGQRIDRSIPLLYVTGNTFPALAPEQVRELKAYVEGGGTLLIDPATGRPEFVGAGVNLVAMMFGDKALSPLPADHPLMTGACASGAGADIRNVRLRRAAGESDKGVPAALSAVVLNGRVGVVVSRYGLACSAEGTPCAENAGYVTSDARKIALNVILNAVASWGGGS